MPNDGSRSLRRTRRCRSRDREPTSCSEHLATGLRCSRCACHRRLDASGDVLEYSNGRVGDTIAFTESKETAGKRPPVTWSYSRKSDNRSWSGTTQRRLASTTLRPVRENKRSVIHHSCGDDPKIGYTCRGRNSGPTATERTYRAYGRIVRKVADRGQGSHATCGFLCAVALKLLNFR